MKRKWLSGTLIVSYFQIAKLAKISADEYFLFMVKHLRTAAAILQDINHLGLVLCFVAIPQSYTRRHYYN